MKKARYVVALLLALTVVVAFFLFVPDHLNQEESLTDDFKETKRVLLISSYSPSFETFFQQIDGIKSQFQNMNIMFDFEFMDSKRFFTDENLNNFYNDLKYKIDHSLPYDVVMLADDNALNFGMEHREELFENIPIVFFGVNNHDKAEIVSEDPYITGVIENPSIYETIEIASKLKPNSDNVVAIVDNTTSGQADLVSYYGEEDKFEDLVFNDLDLSNYTFTEYAEKLQELDESDIVLLLSLYSDKSNQRLSFGEGLVYLLKNCSQPVFHPYYHGLGDGILGGKVISHYEQGSHAAAIAIDILSGKPVSNMSLVTDDLNKYIFDYNIIKKYNINENILPEETEFINKTPTIFDEYREHVTFIIILIVALLLFISMLLYYINEKDRVEKALKKQNILTKNLNRQLATANLDLVSAIQKTEEQNTRIMDLVYIDALSGLKNRYAIEEVIEKALLEKKDHETMALIFIDIDNFKNINDTYGHNFGDKVITITGSRLAKYQNEKLFIGRFGGDEFLILWKNVKEKREIIDLCITIQNIFDKPITIDQHSLFLTASIGAVVIDKDKKDMRRIIKEADLALYEAKSLGKNCYVIFNESIEKDFLRSAYIQQQILKALRLDAFKLYYQPCINANSLQISGFEALIRLFPDGAAETIPAYEIIKNAENMGLIMDVGEWAIEQSCLFSKKINEKRADKIIVSANVSARQLNNKDFLLRLIDLIEKINISPQLIRLEITETAMIESIEAGKLMLEEFHKHGFTVSLDDFGAGYSSLRYLKELPIDVIKIDKTFIDNVTTSTYEQRLIGVISQFAHEKGMHVVAEGVETKQQFEYVQMLGCDTIQGYLFSKPLTETDALAYIKYVE